MTDSVHTWHGHLDDSFMEDIEEGVLDQTDATTLRFQENLSAFPKTAEHGWKELVSDLSRSEIEIISENSKMPVGGVGHKDWDHYLSAFSLNDEDTTKFVNLEVDTDHTKVDLCISGANFKEDECSVKGNKSGIVAMQEKVSQIVGKKNIESQEDLNEEVIEQRSSSKNSFSHSLEDATYPVISKQNSAPPRFVLSEKEYIPDGRGLNETENVIVRPDSAPTIRGGGIYSQPESMSEIGLLTTSNMVYLEQRNILNHVSGDGMTSDDDVNGTDNGDQHSVVISVCNESDSKIGRESRLNTNSSDTKHISALDHTGNTTNVATSREAAENLPVRPLTIGNSLTIGSTFAYRPISPFQPDLYPTSTTIPATVLPSTSSAVATSPSQYSEGMLDEESGDMSARERLQPLGRDGLEVKQGPPWGIMMPLFQPDSRNSSLSSNDSSTNSTQFLQVQTTPNQQQFQIDTEQMQSVSSTPSEGDLSRKASIKSLETKEPMGIKMMKTPIGKFHQQNLVDADSPVSRILGPTFKTTQKILEELQRRPLGAYDDNLEQLPICTENTHARESSVEKETPIERGPVSDNRLDRGYGSQENTENSHVEEKSSHDSKRSHNSISSGQKIHNITRDIANEAPQNQRTPDLTARTTAQQVLHDPETDGLQGGLVIKTPSNIATQYGSKSELDSAPKTEANIGFISTTHSLVASVKDNIVEEVDSNLLTSSSIRNKSRRTQQTSGLTDSTLENSVGLSDHVDPAETKGAEFGSTEPESPKFDNVLENCSDASNLNEFDRVASASISWSNAVANQFREEMKSANYKVQEGFTNHKYDESLVNEQGVTASILDSGLSESSTNDEIYRPKQLARLSAGNGPVGIYDVRQSCGPGSSNRKRLALGRKPRETSKSLRRGEIYVSDGTMETSSTDRDHQKKNRKSRHRVHGDLYVSEGTTSGTEAVDNGVDSGPERQSTPKSADISARQSNTHTTSVFSSNGPSKPPNDIYPHLTITGEAKRGRSGFTSYEIKNPTRLSPSAFTNYTPLRQRLSPFSTFEMDKPQRKDPSETVIRGSDNLETKLLAGVQQSSTVKQPTAQVEHTWSISKPVMSQLSTRAAPSMTHHVYRSTTEQQSSKQTTSYHPVHQRSPRHKETIPKTVREHVKDQTSSSMESEKKHSGPMEKKKSVADIILENMIQDEQEQKKRHKKLEVKQKQTTQDLNQLWERFQDVFGKKSKRSHKSKTSPFPQPYRETTPTDISMDSSSDTDNKNIGRQSIDVSTDSDEEFERFLRRIREIQSSESSYQEDNMSRSSKPSSSDQHDESETTAHLRRKPVHKVVNSSSSKASTALSEDGRIRRPQASSRQKATRRNGPGAPLSLVRKSEPPVSLPMWLSVNNAEMMKQRERSSLCTCGAKSKKETKKTVGVRDIGINCPTPPVETQEFTPVTTDIAVLRTEPSEENISNSATLVKLSLQDAFLYSQQQFIERSRERVKRVKEKRDNRQNEKTTGAQVVIVMPSEKIGAKKENKKPDDILRMKSNKQFEQLQHKKPRAMSIKEIRDVNKRMYKNLPEVRKKRDEQRRAEFYKTNRLRAQLYGKHVRNTNRIFTAA